jgi:hypothetical protein
MAKLIGNGVSQVPTNGDLGTMAFMDYDVVAPQFLAGGRRNLIINGAMQVAQRGTSETGITGTKYSSVDRFQIGLATLGTWTASQSSDAPNGFNVSAKLTCTTADASPAAGDVLWFQQLIEAQDCQSLAYGTSDAKALTLSFWVKSNVTGTATLTILQPDNSNKLLSPTYTISSADTWEYKTISIPADTSGLINNDNGAGFSIYWMLNSGTNYSSGTNRTSWATYNAADRNASNLGVGGATSDYFAITGVQLEVGSVATPFEHRSYGEELALCQRDYWKAMDAAVEGATHGPIGCHYTSSITRLTWFFPQTMRSAPTLTFSGTLNVYSNNQSDPCTSFNLVVSDNRMAQLNTAQTTATSGHACFCYADQSNAAKIEFDAEL